MAMSVASGDISKAPSLAGSLVFVGGMAFILVYNAILYFSLSLDLYERSIA